MDVTILNYQLPVTIIKAIACIQIVILWDNMYANETAGDPHRRKPRALIHRPKPCPSPNSCNGGALQQVSYRPRSNNQQAGGRILNYLQHTSSTRAARVRLTFLQRAVSQPNCLKSNIAIYLI